MNDHFHSDVNMKIIDNLKLQSSVKNVFKNEEMLTGGEGRDSELRIRMKEECLRARRRIGYICSKEK